MMWEVGQYWGDGTMASFQSIHILLVDHDFDSLQRMADLFKKCQYRVSYVELASAAISMLLNATVKFDVVIASIDSPDLHSSKLLETAVGMGLSIFLLSDDDNPYMALKALEKGAFLYIQKPITMETSKTLWQHVVRERSRMARERDVLVSCGVQFKDTTLERSEQFIDRNVVISTNKGIKKNRRRSGGNYAEGDNSNQNHSTHHRNSINKKMCTEWTQELHQKFMDAVEKLGEGRCFPKDILEMMNVPGLTRMQVASHLQKCRNDNWRSPEERKINQPSQQAYQETNVLLSKQRRFGSKPQLGKSSSTQGKEVCETNHLGQKSEKNSDATSGFMIYEPSPHNAANSSKHQPEGQPFHYHNGFPTRNVSEPGNSRNPNYGNGVHYFNRGVDQHEQARNCMCMKEPEGRKVDNRSHWSYGASSSSDRSMNKFA